MDLPVVNRDSLKLVLGVLALLLPCLPAGPAVAQTAVRAGLAAEWRFREAGVGDWRAATVPGTVHTDLLAHGLIPDPFTGAVEPALQWVETRDWEYATRLVPPPAATAHRHVELVFEGLDTWADVSLDGAHLLTADNMFRDWRVDVTRQLRAVGEPELLIRFRSPIPIEDSLAAAYPQRLPAGNDPHGTRVFSRKAAYHYGWDWGPRYVTSGIWQPVRWHAWTGATLRNAAIEQLVLTDSVAVLRVLVNVEADTAQTAVLLVTSPVGAFPAASVQQVLARGRNDVALELSIPRPRRWWPNGLGEPHLYDVSIELQRDGRRLDALDRRIGLRTVEMVHEPDAIGTSFFLKVNGVPVFMKGANVIPLDHFGPRVDSARYARLFQDVRAAHMNMLRVWGGGTYEQDIFYDLADQHGILVWQDFMFANAMYPGSGAFLTSVRAEAEHQVRRLRHHPSIALWCGNNEIREGWENWGWQRELGYSPADSVAVRAAYDSIFHAILPGAVAALDPGRFYWPSSPSIGWGHAESLAHGDAHYWGVWWGEEPFEVLARKLPRFMSEFGFQAYPALASIARFTDSADRQVGSPVMLAHQKHPRGDELIRTYLARSFRPPTGFDSFVYLSQLLQAEGIGLALEAHRRARPRTMGSLYWQLNDTWPVVSWSSIDYYGNWKALHWFARRAFAPLLVSPVLAGDVIAVHLVSDLQLPVTGTLTVRTFTFDGREVYRASRAVTAAAGASILAAEVPRPDALRGTSAASAVLEASFAAADGATARHLLWFAEPKDLLLPDPGLQLQTGRDAEGGWEVAVSARALARAVELIADAPGRFEDNWFDLLPGEARRIRFLPNGPPPAALLVQARSLADAR